MTRTDGAHEWGDEDPDAWRDNVEPLRPMHSLPEREPPSRSTSAPIGSPSPFEPWAPIADLGPDWFTDAPPPRDFLLRREGEGALAQGIVGLLVAPGGRGKTMGLLQLSLSVAVRRPWLDTFDAARPGRVVLGLAEEELGEVRRRLYWAARALDLTAHERNLAEQNIVPLGLAGQHVGLVETTPKGTFPSALHAALIEKLSAAEYDLVILDPLSRWAPDCESSNATATSAIQALEALTKAPGNPTVLVAHHTPKWSRREGTPTDSTAARGVTGLVDAVRWCAVLGGRTETDISLAITKSNYARQGSPVALVRDDSGILRPATAEELAAARGAEHAQEAERRAAVLALVGEEPGIGKGRLRDAVPGRAEVAAATIEALVMEGAIVNLGTGAKHCYHLAAGDEGGAGE